MPLYPGYLAQEGNLITVDQALTMPESITQRLSEIIEPNLLVDRVFSGSGQAVQGGGVIYSQITEKHLYLSTDVLDREPGDEYPVVYADRPEPRLAKVQDFGGKFAVTDEARRRNQSVDFDNDVTKLANTITRKLNQRAIETLEAGLSVLDDNGEVAGHSWSGLNFEGSTGVTKSADRPTADFAAAQLAADQDDMGITYTQLLVNPQQKAALAIAYGKDLTAVLDSFGLEIFSSLHIPAGTAYMVDPGQVGFVDYEEPLTTTTWRDEHHRQKWVQSYAMPVMGVTNPRAIRRITGLN